MASEPQKTSVLKGTLEQLLPENLVELLKEPALQGTFLDQIVKLHSRNEGLMEMVLAHPNVMPQTLLFLYGVASAEFKKRMQQLKRPPSSGAEKEVAPAKDLDQEPPSTDDAIRPDDPSEEKLSLFQRVQRMKVSEKVALALHGGKDARSLLLKDPNRQVSQAVLGSPKITEDEILLIAQSRNVSDEILRTVGKNKDWITNYSIRFSLVCNPKTPLGVSMSLLSLIKGKDLGIISKSKSIPEAVRMAANRLLAAKQKQS
jgi:hypothetical protein